MRVSWLGHIVSSAECATVACSVRSACRGVGLAFARRAFWLVLRPRTRWPPCVRGGQPHSMFANSSCDMKGEETSNFLGFVVVLADRWKHAKSDGVMLWNAGVALDSAVD